MMRSGTGAALPRHALNTAFEWRQPAPPYELITAAQADAYRDLGGFVLEDAFQAGELAPLIEALDAFEAQANAALADWPEDRPTIARHDEIVFRPHPVLESEAARDFSRHPVFQGLCRDLIGSPVRLYWDQLVYKRPGTAAPFPWHQDNGYTYVSPQQYLTCWVALNDATEANGCPAIAPGLHRQGTLEHRWTPLGFECLDDEALPVAPVSLPLKAGSVAVFSSLTPHRTGPNLTEDVRKAYILQYAGDGAVVHPRSGPPAPAADPDRQYLVA